jgi:hypothetical protein
MAFWIECKGYGSIAGTTIYVNLDQVVSLSGDEHATVVRYAGNESAEFVVAGPPLDMLRKASVAIT